MMLVYTFPIYFLPFSDTQLTGTSTAFSSFYSSLHCDDIVLIPLRLGMDGLRPYRREETWRLVFSLFSLPPACWIDLERDLNTTHALHWTVRVGRSRMGPSHTPKTVSWWKIDPTWSEWREERKGPETSSSNIWFDAVQLCSLNHVRIVPGNSRHSIRGNA